MRKMVSLILVMVMLLTLAVPGVAATIFPAGQVLDQRPAKADVDQLHASADAQNRFLLFYKYRQDFHLERVQFIYDSSALLILLPVHLGIHIASAREQKSVVIVRPELGIVQILLLYRLFNVLGLDRDHNRLHSGRMQSMCIILYILVYFRKRNSGFIHKS